MYLGFRLDELARVGAAAKRVINCATHLLTIDDHGEIGERQIHGDVPGPVRGVARYLRAVIDGRPPAAKAVVATNKFAEWQRVFRLVACAALDRWAAVQPHFRRPLTGTWETVLTIRIVLAALTGMAASTALSAQQPSAYLCEAFAVPGSERSAPMVTAPDGGVWYTANNTNRLIRVDANRSNTALVPVDGATGQLNALTLRTDGRVWFS